MQDAEDPTDCFSKTSALEKLHDEGIMATVEVRLEVNLVRENDFEP